MEIRQICRTLILIFLLLSLLFNYLYTAEFDKRTVVSDEFVSDAVENLSSHEIQVSESNIEKKMPERDIYYFELNSNDEYFDKITLAICNSIFFSNIETTEFDTPDGYSVGFHESDGNEKEIGRITFSVTDLSFVFSKNGIGMQNGDKPIENMQIDEISTEKLAVIDRVVSNFNNDLKLGYKITGSSSNDTFLIVTAMQTIDGNEISDSFVNFVFKDNELVLLAGKWITEQPKAKYHNTLLDGVNVLYKLNLEDVKSIDEEKVVYSLRKTDGNKYFVIPCWQIKYTDKKDNLIISYFDAL